jgi:hypothetical protein
MPTLEELEIAVGLLADRVTALESATDPALSELQTAVTALDGRVTDAEADIALLAGRATAAEAGLEDVNGSLTALQLSTPTLEELLFSTVITTWNGATTFTSGPRMTLMVAPFPVRILGAGINIEYTTLGAGQPAIAASQTNYWRLTLERGLPSGSFPDMASKTTQSTGAEAGGAILTRKAWTFDSANWNAERDLDAGDLLCLLWAGTGTPTEVRLPMTVTVRYAAL